MTNGYHRTAIQFSKENIVETIRLEGLQMLSSEVVHMKNKTSHKNYLNSCANVVRQIIIHITSRVRVLPVFAS